MKNLQINKLALWALTIAALGIGSAQAQYQVTTLGTAVLEDFNGLQVPTGTITAVNFNAALGSTTQAQRNAAWVLSSAVGRGNDNGGGAPGGGYTAYANVNTSTDKALGELGNAGITSGNATATFLNATGSAVTSFVLSYTGEQWRANAGAGSITVQYSINGGAFTALSTSTFNLNIVNSTNTSCTTTGAGALNGDAAGNRTTGLGANVTGLSISNGQNVQFRFIYAVGSNSKAVAIDDVSVTFNGTGGGGGGGGGNTLAWVGGSGTWTQTSGTNWAGGAWDSSKTADFGVTPGTVTVSGLVTGSAGLQFDVGGYVLSGGTLALAGSTSATNSITTSTGTTTITTALSGSNGMTVAGAGKLLLNGDNSGLTGGISQTAGVLAVGSANSLGGNALSLTGGTITSASGTALSISNNTTFGNSVTLGEAGTGNITLSGSVAFGGATLTTVSNVTLSGTTSGSLTKSGSGTLDFATTANTLTGLSVTSGTAIIDSGAKITLSSGAITTNSGATLLVSGTLLNQSTTGWTAPGGTVEITNGGSYIHNTTAGMSAGLTANFKLDTGSSFTYLDSGAPSVSAKTYYNLSILSTSGTSYTNIGGGGAWTVNGDLTIGTGVSIAEAGAGADVFGGNVTVSGSLTNAKGFTISGSNAGMTLTVNGAIVLSSSSSGINIGNTGTLKGSGSITSGTVTILDGGTLSPGNSPGLLSISTLVLSGSATTVMEITGTDRGTTYDALNITGSNGLIYGGTLKLLFSGLVSNNQTFDLLSLIGTPSGDFAAVSLYANTTLIGSLLETSGTWSGTLDLGFGSGNQTFTFSQTTGDLGVIPEPQTWALMGIGLGFVLFFRRRRYLN